MATVRPVLLASGNGESLTHAYAALKMLVQRLGLMSFDLVTPTARGGIGTRLLQTAIDWAAANDVDRVVLWPTARSRSLYRRHGFVANGGVLELTCP